MKRVSIERSKFVKMKCLAVLIALFCSACRPGTIEPFVYLPEEPVACGTGRGVDKICRRRSAEAS